MDFSLLIFLNGFLLAFLNATAPVYSRFTPPLDGPLKHDFGSNDSLLANSNAPLMSSGSTEPDSSGDTEMVPGDAVLTLETTHSTVDLPSNLKETVTESVEALLLSQSPDQASKTEEKHSESPDAPNSFEASDDLSDEDASVFTDFTKKLFGNLSKDYIDDYNKSQETAQPMDKNKQYKVRALVPVDDILVLATPSGCSLMDFSGDEPGLQMVDLSFSTSQLSDCGALTKDLVSELTEHLARDLSRHSQPVTKMVEISVRDPLRNKQLNIKETTQVLNKSKTHQTQENVAGSTEFSDDLRSSFEQDSAVPEHFRKEAYSILSDSLDLNLLPTDTDSVVVMSFSLVDQEDANKREQLLNDFYSLLTNSPEDEEKSTDKTNSTKSEETPSKDEKLDLMSVVKNIPFLSNDTLSSLLDETKKLLATDEGKKALEDFNKEIDKNVEETKKMLQEEFSTGRQILDDLSKHGVENVECSKLSKDDCEKYSKCQMMKLDGKESCFVSPKTIFWLLETNCGLQSKSALLSIARDLRNIGIINSKRLNNLEKSFNLRKLCNAITHSYLSKLSPRSNQQPNNAFN